jgi:AsmA protein
MKKILFIITAAIAVIIIAFTAFIKIYVTPERVRQFVVPTAEKTLNRKVDLGEISISLLKGIGLRDFAIKESDEKSDFIRCKEFLLKFKLLPLLSKQVIVDELRLVSPSVNIARGKNGRFNFDTIGKRKETEKPGEETSDNEDSGLPISLLVHRVSVTDGKFSLDDFLNELPDIKSTADINISIESIDGANISTEGSIDITLNDLVLKKPSQKHIKDLTTGLKYSASFNMESNDLHIDKANLKVQGVTASLTGDLRNLKTSPEADIALTLPKVKTAELQELAALFADLKGLALSGDLAADVKLKGKLEKPDMMKANGSIAMEKLGIRYNEINAMLDGNIKFSENLLNIDIKSTLDKNTAEIKGTVKNYLKDQDINLNVYSKKLFIDELIPAGTTAGKAPGTKSGTASPGKTAKEAEPLELKLKAKGEIKVDSAVYQNMQMNDFHMTYTFKDNKLNISKLSAKAGKGVINLNSFVDMSRPGYRYRLSGNIDSIHADEMVNSFVPKAKDTVFGIVSLNVKMNGAGTLPEKIKKNLVADADFNIKDGKITGAPLTRELSQFFNISELETINLTKADGRVNIKNGIARLDSIFSSDDMSMDPRGNIGLDETLDLVFDLKLSPRLTGKAMSSKISKYIKSDEGWGMIPLKVTGTFSKPFYMVDIEKAGKQAIEKEVDRQIDKLFNKQGEDKKKELEPVKDLLKEFFK